MKTNIQLLFIALLSSTELFGQPLPPPPPQGGAPLDAIAMVLLVVGVAFGIKKLLEHRKQTEKNPNSI